jgi:DNA-binding transcriptional regulator YhcF (GntR family)
MDDRHARAHAPLRQDTPSPDTDIESVVHALRTFIADTARQTPGRLPPERSLAERFGLSRTQLRKALAVLEHEGQIWRHVGKGTFIGPRPPELIDVADLAHRTTPIQVMRARFAIEPELASLAALNATAGEIDNEISMVKFGKPARLTMQFLMRIGHPIDEVSVARSRMHQRRWRWNPPPSESSCRRTQET